MSTHITFVVKWKKIINIYGQKNLTAVAKIYTFYTDGLLKELQVLKEVIK